MEVDFNFYNKLIFGKKMLNLTREHNLVPDKIYSKKGRITKDAILHQVLAYNIARQKRAPFIVASVDVVQCYNRGTHTMLALTLRASKVLEILVNCMLQPLCKIEFYVRTAYWESESYAGGKFDIKQGEDQGNRTAPAGW